VLILLLHLFLINNAAAIILFDISKPMIKVIPTE
jgi:hypothetical protein